jgi:hypothetical protein
MRQTVDVSGDTDFQKPAVRRSADFRAGVSFQSNALPMQGSVIAVFAVADQYLSADW